LYLKASKTPILSFLISFIFSKNFFNS